MWFKKKNKDRPDGHAALCRLLVLKRMVVYSAASPPVGMLQAMMKQQDESQQAAVTAKVEQVRGELIHRLKVDGLYGALTPKELEFAGSTFLTMTQQQRIDFSWRLEGAVTLMWALQLIPQLPPYDQQSSPELLKQIPSQGVDGLSKKVQLRAADEIERARDTAEFWHWRSRTRQLIERGDLPPGNLKHRGINSFDDIVRMSANKAEADGLFKAIDADFPAFGKAYRNISAGEWSQIQSITRERHFALNWLTGKAPEGWWDETPTGT